MPVVALGPAEPVAVVGERERTGARQTATKTPFKFRDELRQAHAFDRVFQPRMLAVRTVAVVALHGHHLLRHVHRLLRRAESDHVAGAREGVRLAMGHPHAAADDHVVADDPPVLFDRNEAEIVGEHVHVVVRRQCNGDLEFARHVGAAVDRFVFLLAAGQLFAVDPDLVPGAASRQQMRADRLRKSGNLAHVPGLPMDRPSR